MLQLSECTKNIPCIDCDEEGCIHHGVREAVCPKWKCSDNCEECTWIDEYIEKLRKEG